MLTMYGRVSNAHKNIEPKPMVKAGAITAAMAKPEIDNFKRQPPHSRISRIS